MVAIMGGNGKADAFDVGADGITITEERAKNVDFSDPYITSQESLLVRKEENRFSTPDDLKAMTDLKVGTQLGTTNYDAAVDLVGKDRVVAFDQFGPAVQALINGDVDAVIIDNVAGMGYVGVNAEKLKLLPLPVHTEELGFMFNKGSNLVAPVNAGLAAIKSDGTLDSLYKKWFVDYVPESSATLTDTTTVTTTSTVTQ
jgi:polar amino acid transport system substrate-binding protein